MRRRLGDEDDGSAVDDDSAASVEGQIFVVALALVSCLSSAVMIASYFCQKSSAPRLLLWLFVSNFLWFASLSTLLLWNVSSDWQVGDECRNLALVDLFFMTYSMLWPSVISFDLLMNTRKPRWRWDQATLIELVYLFIVGVLAAACVGTVHSSQGDQGCKRKYEQPGGKSVSVIVQAYLPMCAMLFNVVCLAIVRQSLGRELPFSVRTRRRRQLHNYVVVWVICWVPYVANALLSFLRPSALDGGIGASVYFIRNLFLYSWGYLCVLVYGLQNAWLKRSLRMACDRVRLSRLCCLETVEAEYLRSPTDKSVKFHPDIPDRLPRWPSKYYVLRCRLTREEKYNLYTQRPDLDMSLPLNCDVFSEDVDAQDFGVARSDPHGKDMHLAVPHRRERGSALEELERQARQRKASRSRESSNNAPARSADSDLTTPLVAGSHGSCNRDAELEEGLVYRQDDRSERMSSDEYADAHGSADVAAIDEGSINR